MAGNNPGLGAIFAVFQMGDQVAPLLGGHVGAPGFGGLLNVVVHADKAVL